LPAVAVSSQLSEAVYFVSIIGLAVLLARPVYLVYSGSQERSAQAVASGLEAMIDSMSPGTTVVTSLESYPGVQLSVALRGTTVAVSFGNATATAQVRWALPHTTLSPGAAYSFTLKGGEVAVAQARNG
jgi:ABC-type nitrate/sulfonate/bicarbonate transport system substrate-binding protein